MERLTNFWGNLKKCIECTERSNCYNHSCGHIAESVAKLRDYEELEEEGKLLRIPVAVGGTVYEINRNKLFPLKVIEIQFFALDKQLTTQVKCTEEDSYGYSHFSAKDIGETVFPTREAAEAKLMEMEGAE